ncbi:MAG: PspC domain-containing protein [Erythrobacter sp.]|nr:PspC domain-containing protein [Erythrobacter sp.]
MNDLRNSSTAGAPSSKSFALGRGNAKLMGVCSGIARHFEIDVTLVRVGFVLGTLFGFGLLVPIYLAIGLIAD